jgi:hypothetical protein
MYEASVVPFDGNHAVQIGADAFALYPFQAPSRPRRPPSASRRLHLSAARAGEGSSLPFSDHQLLQQQEQQPAATATSSNHQQQLAVGATATAATALRPVSP